MVTSSSDAVGCTASVASNCALVAPQVMAMWNDQSPLECLLFSIYRQSFRLWLLWVVLYVGVGMALHFRRSVKAGPFRFNFSKSGIGLSVGVRGFRFGTGPQGHFIHAGVGGIYYRKTFSTKDGGKPNSQTFTPTRQLGQNSQVYYQGQDGIRFLRIESGDLDGMTDSQVDAIISDISEKMGKNRKSWTFGLAVGLIAAAAFSIEHSAAFVGVPLTVIAILVGNWLDSFQRVTVLMYNLDPVFLTKFQNTQNVFLKMSRCECSWHIPDAGRIETLKQWKRNAGASTVVHKNSIHLVTGLPETVRCNIDVPIIPLGRKKLYFFPDFLLVTDRGKVAGVSYSELQIKVQTSNFVEEGRIPTDSRVVGRRWKHPNKGGGPDRRYNDNCELPVCEYEDILFRSESGLLELIELSKPGYGAHFKQCLQRMAKNEAARINTRLLT
jgi:Protein of unknown function (DUF4236)